jgi:hypothetical protein
VGERSHKRRTASARQVLLAKTARDQLRLNDLAPLCAAVLKPLNTTACSDVSALLFHADETPPLPLFTDQKPKKINRKF